MRENFSDGDTWLVKYFGAFFVGPTLTLCGWMGLFYYEKNIAPLWVRVGLFSVLLLWSLRFAWRAWAFKLVSLDTEKGVVYISDFKNEISVPLANVERVEYLTAMNANPVIKIMFKKRTVFGRSIVFLGRDDSKWYEFKKFDIEYMRKHPMVTRLQNIVIDFSVRPIQ